MNQSDQQEELDRIHQDITYLVARAVQSDDTKALRSLQRSLTNWLRKQQEEAE